jgi:hypothetical protein
LLLVVLASEQAVHFDECDAELLSFGKYVFAPGKSAVNI